MKSTTYIVEIITTQKNEKYLRREIHLLGRSYFSGNFFLSFFIYDFKILVKSRGGGTLSVNIRQK